MSNEYTPSLEEVRENYGWNGHDSYIESNRVASRAEFDRFIKRYRAEAWQEGWEDGRESVHNFQGKFDRNPYKESE